MKLEVKVNSSFGVENIERDEKSPSWVENYEFHNGKEPVLYNYLLPLVNNYVRGQPITKDIKVIPISGQQWQLLTDDERDKLLELVEWLGKQTAEEYVREFQSHNPRTPLFSQRGS